jgi:hypothetical protein
MSHDAQRHDTHGAVPPQTLGQRLREVDGNLPEALRAQCLAAGTALVPELLLILEEDIADAQADHGWAPVHTAELLGMLGDAQAVPLLLRCLQGGDKLDLFGSVSKVEMTTPMALICKALFPSISTFETPPTSPVWTRTPPSVGTAGACRHSRLMSWLRIIRCSISCSCAVWSRLSLSKRVCGWLVTPAACFIWWSMNCIRTVGRQGLRSRTSYVSYSIGWALPQILPRCASSPRVLLSRTMQRAVSI